MASNAITATNLANWLPTVQATLIKAEMERSLICAKCVDRRYEAELIWGKGVDVPNLANMGDADSVSTTADLTLYDVVQNTDQILANYHYYKAVGFGEKELLQTRPNPVEAFLAKCAYAVAKKIDDTIAALFNAFTQSVGTEGSALTDDVLLTAREYLDVADAPAEDRFLIIDPKSLTDLLKIDKFLTEQYVERGVVASGGLVGRSIYGADVYVTNNLEVVNVSYHGAAMMHREAIALIMQMTPTVIRFEWPEKFTPQVLGVKALWGCKAMRDTFGVWIKTRA